MVERRHPQITVRADDDVRRKLDEIATHRHVTVSDVIRILVHEEHNRLLIITQEAQWRNVLPGTKREA
jgi:predicted transcriptional regulator